MTNDEDQTELPFSSKRQPIEQECWDEFWDRLASVQAQGLLRSNRGTAARRRREAGGEVDDPGATPSL